MPRKRLLLLLLAGSAFTIVFAIFSVIPQGLWNTFGHVLPQHERVYQRERDLETEREDSIEAAVFSTKIHTSIAPVEVKGQEDDNVYILLWTAFFGTMDYLPSTDEVTCEERRCILTSDRKLLSKSAAVVFHFVDTDIADVPQTRTPNQRWIVFTIESPLHSDLSFFNHLVNWTATYRLDSDLVTPYGHVRRLNASEEESKVKEPRRNYAASKTKMVAWFVSNCNTPSGREMYIRRLQEVIPVDVFGACGNNTCEPRMSPACYDKVGKDYRFYLSFENSLCKDYVTEKFFHILKTDMIPVVFGDANYSQIAPKGSFIDALSFHSPMDLGKFLLKVAGDEVRYNSYFEWKRHFALGGYHWVCSMCKKLHNPTEKPSVYHNLQKWWNEDSHCWTWTSGENRTLHERQ